MCHCLVVKQATALVVTYPVVNAVSEDGNAAAVAWELEFIRLVKVFDSPEELLCALINFMPLDWYYATCFSKFEF